MCDFYTFNQRAVFIKKTSILQSFSKDSLKKNLRLRIAWLSFFLLFIQVALSAQTVVNGNVSDETGIPVIGANVLVKGTTVGVITDIDGNFIIQVQDIKNSILQISFVGYAQQEIKINGRTNIKVVLSEDSEMLEEVTIVAYGAQKKETLTGAISSVKTEELLTSPNASVANSLTGKITGLSSFQGSGQPGAEDASIYIRGVGSLTEGGATPLILVDGVERGFYQMDPNEIESVTVLKDASATAVFGVRGANGVILVTTRRGEEGKTKIAVSSSVGIQQVASWIAPADSYTYANMYNEMSLNDNPELKELPFNNYTLERFRLGDSPIMYPDMNWYDYMVKDAAVQTQHNLNISGGTDRLRYFISLGYLYQDGLMKDFGKGNGYSYNRYNYRTNLDFDISKTTTLKMGIGGIVGDRQEPSNTRFWENLSISQPFAGPGLVNGIPMTSDVTRYYSSIKPTDPFILIYDKGYSSILNNTMNLDLHLVQKLDFITKGLSVEVKGAYNTGYTYTKSKKGNIETWTPKFQSELDKSGLMPGDEGYNYEIGYQIDGTNSKPTISESTGRSRDWYFEASIRYNRKFGNHNVGGLLLYNQNKKYYPSQLPYLPTAYVGLVGRLTYDYKSKYLAEFNIGYNGSENFAPDKRFGTFPAFSLGWILTEESFMKDQKIFDFLKLRASVGLVGNDNMSNNRYLYLPDTYKVNLNAVESGSWKEPLWGYNFGYENSYWWPGSVEQRLGNKNVTWETSLKQNYGIDMVFLNNRLKVTAEYFMEHRKDILISRKTLPIYTSLSSKLLPVVNMGEVDNKGYELEISWNDKIGNDFRYNINANMSYSKNKIIFQDEVEPNEPYLWRTGKEVGAVFGYVCDGFYGYEDFVNGKDGELVEGLAKPQIPVYPGDAKYRDLNNDGVIDPDDMQQIGFPKRPNYTFGFNLGLNYKGFFFNMSWAGTAQRSVVLPSMFREPFMGEARGLMQYQVDGRWTPETAETALYPRFAKSTLEHNSYDSTLWVQDGSYFKLKDLSIGYNFTGYEALKKLGISQLGIKLTGYNLLTLSKFDIMDPEFVVGWENTKYPVTRIYNLGLNITF